jgi:hypothetical protein
MPERVVNLGLATYIDTKGDSRFAMKGDTVDVHPEHVDRFDELNVDMGPDFDPIRQSDEMMTGAGERPTPQNRAPAKK